MRDRGPWLTARDIREQKDRRNSFIKGALVGAVLGGAPATYVALEQRATWIEREGEAREQGLAQGYKELCALSSSMAP